MKGPAGADGCEANACTVTDNSLRCTKVTTVHTESLDFIYQGFEISDAATN